MQRRFAFRDHNVRLGLVGIKGWSGPLPAHAHLVIREWNLLLKRRCINTDGGKARWDDLGD